VVVEEKEKQPQILRLTTPKLHPKEQKTLFGDPGERLGPRSLRMTPVMGRMFAQDDTCDGKDVRSG